MKSALVSRLAIVLLACFPSAARPSAAVASEDEAILAVIDRFMRAVSTRDAAAFSEILLPDAMTVREGPVEGGPARLVRRPFAPIPPGDEIRERYWNPTVSVRGGIAVVWTPYEFWRNGVTSHCGIDVFDLIKENGRWRIANMMWTVEPGACPALRPSDASAVRPRP